MSASRCPYCMDEVRIPAGLPESAVVRCPLCEEEYALSEVGLPPLLQVVSGAVLVGSGVGAESDGGFSIAPAIDDQPQGSGMPAFSLSGDAAAAGDLAAPRPVTKTRRPTKKKGSAAREVAKIVGGGIVGLAIGQLALWYLPGEWKTKQRDPFGLGPHVAKVAPWLVPEQVSGKPSPSPLSPDNNNDQSNGGAGDTAGAPVALDSPDLDNVGMNANAKSQKGKRKGKGKGKQAPMVNLGSDPDPAADLGLDVLGNDAGPSVDVPNISDPLATIGEPPKIDDPLATVGEPPSIDDPLATVGEPPSIDDPLATVNDPPAPSGGAEDLVAGINAAAEANQTIISDWEKFTTEQKISVSKGYYDQLVKVAKALDDLGPKNKVARNRKDELRELFRTTDQNAAPRDTIYHFGSQQMDAGVAGPVVLYGLVESMGKIADQPIVRLQLKSGGSALILCPGPHDGSYKTGKGMFLFGTRLTDDEHQYDDSQVVRASVLSVP